MRKLFSNTFNPHTPLSLFWVAVCALLLFTTYTRLYKLGEIPAGITWDEAAIGYNGYSILTTRRDEWLIKLPISFRSFGDYKAPFAIYTNGFFTYVFGLNAWAVRLPFALAGILFVGAMGLLTNELTSNSSYRKEVVLISMLIAATSPWHLHYSRVGFESGIALFFVTAGTALLLRALRTLKNTTQVHTEIKRSYIFSAIAVGLLLLSIYTYHSAKITVPLLTLSLTVLFWRVLQQHWIYFLLLTIVSLLLLFPLINDTLYGAGGTRANVLIFSQQLGFFNSTGTIIANIGKHFTFEFLVNGSVDSARHGAGKWGVLSVITFMLAVVGVILSVIKINLKGKHNLLVGTALLFILLGILPAALSAEIVPHSNRALLALPGFILLAITGLLALLEIKESRDRLMYRKLIGLVVLLELAFFLSFWQHYTTKFLANSASAFQEGYIPAMNIAYQFEKGLNGKPEVDKILVSSEYGQPYIYALFVKNPSPIAYQGGTLYKYEFTDHISISDLERNNTLILATPKFNMPQEKAFEVIKGSDGSTRFLLFYTGTK